MTAIIAGVAAGALIGGYAGSRTSTTRTMYDLWPWSSVIPPGLEFLYGGGPNAELYGEGVEQVLEAIANPYLDKDILTRMLADVTSGVEGARDIGAQEAAFGLGPTAMTSAQTAITAGRVRSQTRVGFELASEENARENMAMLGPFLSVLQTAQAIRSQNPSMVSTTDPGAGWAAGALEGAGTGGQIGAMIP